MKLIAFSGMMCHPYEIKKDGDFRIKATMTKAKDMPELVRYEYFACVSDRDKRYNMIINLLNEQQ